MSSETTVLRVSIAVTIFLAIVGVIVGLLAGSFSIVFDGVYSLMDASMTILALLVARLIASSAEPGGLSRKLQDRFTMGFWHLEPMVLGLNGIVLVGVAVYALINAIGSLITGGRQLDFSYAIFYAVVILIACIGMAIYGLKQNKKLRSDFVALDARAWMMSGGITAALLIAFSVGYAIKGTAYDWVTPYIDPAVLALVCLVIIPLPIATIRQALSDIFLLTPPLLKQHVDAIAQTFVERCGFMSYRAYVAKVGRGTQIELYFVVPAGGPAKPLEEWDKLRDQIGEAIGGDSPDRWLTIVFTTDVEWAT